MDKAEALRQALIKLDEIWQPLFDNHDAFDPRATWHPCDHWFALHFAIKQRLATIEQGMLAEFTNKDKVTT